MATNDTSLNDVDQTINLTFAASDQKRVDDLANLHLVLGAEAQLLIRALELSTQRLGPDDASTVLIAEQIETNKGFLLEVNQEYERARIAAVSVAETDWVLYGFVRDADGNGLAKLTVALFDNPKPGAIWVEGLGRACTDQTGFFRLEAGVIRDYTFAPVYVHVSNAQGATLYLGDTPLTPKAGELNYVELVVGTQSLDCLAPPPSPPAKVDLRITAADTPDPVTPNADLTYTLTVTNLGQTEAKDLKVTDTLPAQTTYVSASGGGFTCTHSDGVVSCTLPTLAAGATATITMVVKVNQEVMHGTVLSNTATVTAATSDTDPTNDTAVTTTTVVSAADLSITMTDTPDPVLAGQNVTYTLQVTNPVGALAAQNVTVTDAVPVNTTFVSAMVTSGSGWTPPTTAVGGTGNVVFSKGVMAAGEGATLQIVVNVNQNTPASTITNTAKVASTTSDLNPANNTATVTTNVIAASADLSITMTDAPDPVLAGQNITYTLQVTNPVGALAAQNVTVTDAVPVNTTFVSAMVMSGSGWTPPTTAVGGTGNVVFSKASVAPGESATFQIVVKVNADTTVASISNTATVTSPTSDKNAANNTTTIATSVIALPASADLQIVKTDDPNPIAPGGNVTYTLTLYNAGPSAAQTVTVTDPVPANTTFVSAAVTSGTGWTPATPAVGSSGNVAFSKALVAPGETATFQIVINVNQNTPASTTIINTATVTSPTSDPNTENNIGIAKTMVKPPSADLSITKIVLIGAGGIITYMLTITNNGPNIAENVKVTDPIPANTTFVSARVTSGAGWETNAPPVGSGGNVVFSKDSVVPRETASFQIVVQLNPDTPVTKINNTATVTSSTTDLDPTHNTVEVDINVQQPKTRRAVIVFTEVNKAGDHTPLQGSPQPSVTFTDNVPNKGDLEAAFSTPPSGFKMKQFKGVTMAVATGPVDADIPARLKAVVTALQNAGGAATLTTGTVVLSAGDQTTLATRKIDIADLDEVIFVELAVA